MVIFIINKYLKLNLKDVLLPDIENPEIRKKVARDLKSIRFYYWVKKILGNNKNFA